MTKEEQLAFIAQLTGKIEAIKAETPNETKPRYVESVICSVGGCDASAVALEMVDNNYCRTHAVEWCAAGHVVVIAPQLEIKCGQKLVFDFCENPERMDRY